MDKKEFWQLIEKAKAKSNDHTDTQLEILYESLQKLPLKAIVKFDKILIEFFWQSNTWRLRAACHIINDGASDDWWDYFRAGLILQGEQVFTQVVKDPETLSEIVTFEEGELSFKSDWAAGVEEMLYIASRAYEAKSGGDMPDYSSEPQDISGDEWEEESLNVVLPKLWAYCSRRKDQG